MTFRFRLGGNGRLEVRGKPVGPATGKAYLRNGTYIVEADRLISPELNEGRPVRVVYKDGQLLLTIDETLALQLRRK
jgi:hypothetical protein